jgi:hypothetical protein
VTGNGTRVGSTVVAAGPRFARLRRWGPVVLAAMFDLAVAALAELGCAVGEYEEDNRTCDASTYPLIGVGVVVLGVVLARVASHPAPRWLGVAAAFALGVVGLGRV